MSNSIYDQTLDALYSLMAGYGVYAFVNITGGPQIFAQICMGITTGSMLLRLRETSTAFDKWGTQHGKRKKHPYIDLKIPGYPRR